uniref:Uncharacterized protein n=1 Tax=Ficedula albicollis TaxID=59894 RepID=A0A803VPA4_FICAL
FPGTAGFGVPRHSRAQPGLGSPGTAGFEFPGSAQLDLGSQAQPSGNGGAPLPSPGPPRRCQGPALTRYLLALICSTWNGTPSISPQLSP